MAKLSLVASVGVWLLPGLAQAHTHYTYYLNAEGHLRHTPERAAHAPPGWSARCRDGSYSFSESRRGTCSWHVGVAVWR